MTDKQIIEYKHMKCTKDDCCHYCGSIFCGYVDDIENLEKAYRAKEQECEELKNIINEATESKLDLKSFLVGEAIQNEYEEQLDQLKAEVKSKTEYIQEQRDIINQYSKEIEMYKKCQGKRASKREEELKAENKRLKHDNGYEVGALERTIDNLKAENDNIKETFDGLFKVQYKLADNNKKLRQCLTEIKEIAEHCIKQDICTICDYSDKCHIEDEEIPTYDICKLILQKISECEVGNEEV